MADVSDVIISSHMHEVQTNLNMVESQLDFIMSTAKEITTELNEGIKCLDQNVAASTRAVKNDEIEKLKNKIKTGVFEECDLLKDTFRGLVEIVIDGNSLIQKEMLVRRKMVENPNDFNEGDLKKIINEKTDPKQVKVKEHPKFVQLEKLIDDAKNGISAGGDDLVVDEPINQVVKCPITQMPIKEIARNTRCDHVYEKSAILQYIKSKPNRKCPFAGCASTVQL